ncbi:MAG: NYN domain-containing protein [Puniceicoccaceae bacterium]
MSLKTATLRAVKRLLLVDVCNLLNRLPGYKDRLNEGIDQLAEQLLAELQPLHDLNHWELHLVVDGKGRQLDQQFHGGVRTLSIVYSPSGVQADTVIESWLLKLDSNWEVRVASEDRAIIHSAISNKAEPLSAAKLLEWVGTTRKRFSQKRNSSRDTQKGFGLSLDDLL